LFIWGYYSGSIRQFKYIQAIDLDRDGIANNYNVKEFKGRVEAKLTSDYQVWWFINGDFYYNGNTSVTVSGGGEAGRIGKTVTGNFSDTKQLDHYEYFEDAGTYSAYYS